ncbi:calcium/sodium antiporter [Patescibacteria group bacterium]|nr:calcium/sodium antiporter [Patescibacteria group bacterium]
MVLGFIALIILLSFVLIKAADMVVVAIRRISKETKTKTFAISAIILALATSFPELFVGITAALEGAPEISLGDIMGSNIANIALVGGLASLIAGRVKVHSAYLKREVGIALVAGLMPVLLLIDGALTRIDGAILLIVYFAYATSFFRRRFVQIGKEQEEEEGFAYRFLRQFNHVAARKRKEMGRLFVGIALLLFSADSIVKIAVHLAELADIPTFTIGLIIVAIGTSLPELAFSFRSLKDHEPSMFFGNLLGSTIANSTLIIGIVSLIHPIELVFVGKYFVSALVFISVFLVFWLFIKTKHRLDRWEAVVLLMMYAIFVTVEFL